MSIKSHALPSLFPYCAIKIVVNRFLIYVDFYLSFGFLYIVNLYSNGTFPRIPLTLHSKILRCSYELNESNRDVLNYQACKQFGNLTRFD